MRAALPPELKTRARIDLSPVEPAKLSFRQPLGVDFNLALSIYGRGSPVDPTPWYPQFALLPRSSTAIYGYAMDVTDPANGGCEVSIPGTAIMDRNGYNVEVYACTAPESPGDPAKPMGLMAQGVMQITGTAYRSLGPLGLISVPTVTGPAGPVGPAGMDSTVPGPEGAAGRRGSMWWTAEGPPPGGFPEPALEGDMYLDTLTGDVWRYDESLGTWTRYPP